MPITTLRIDGAAVAVPDQVVLTSWRLDIDRGDELEFCERGVALPPSFKGGQAVELLDGGVRRFYGVINHDAPKYEDRLGWVRGYRAAGWHFLANQVPFTSGNDGTGSQTWNLPIDDPEYVPAFAGQTIGAILAYCLANHRTYSYPQPGLKSLADLGIGDLYTPVAGDPAYLVDPASLDLVPPDPVTIGGERLWDALQDFLSDWYATHALRIEPDGSIRIYDTTLFAPQTLTLGVDPIDPPSLARDTTDCYTRCGIRSGRVTESCEASLENGLLAKGWTAAEEADWSLDDFTALSGPAGDDGACTVTSSTTIQVTPSDSSKTWAANDWGPATRRGFLWVYKLAATDLTVFEGPFEVTSNTALAAGGSSVVTISSSKPLARTDYTTYKLQGLDAGGLSHVWRRFKITNAPLGRRMVNRFDPPAIWRLHDGTYIDANVRAPVASVMIDPTGAHAKPYQELIWPLQQLDPNGDPDPTITFSRPVVEAFGTHSKLVAGGSGVDGVPDDVAVLLAIAKDPLMVASPPDAAGVPQYEGTAHAVEGIERTHWIDIPSWVDRGNTAQIQLLADQVVKTTRDAVVEGQVRHAGWWSPGTSFGVALNITAGYPTGWESVAMPVRSVEFRWNHAGGDGAPWSADISCSNRRKAFTGVQFYVHPEFTRQLFAGELGSEVVSPFGRAEGGSSVGISADEFNHAMFDGPESPEDGDGPAPGPAPTPGGPGPASHFATPIAAGPDAAAAPIPNLGRGAQKAGGSIGDAAGGAALGLPGPMGQAVGGAIFNPAPLVGGAMAGPAQDAAIAANPQAGPAAALPAAVADTSARRSGADVGRYLAGDF